MTTGVSNSGEAPQMGSFAAIGFVAASIYVYLLVALAVIVIVLPVLVEMDAFVIRSGSMSPALSEGDVVIASAPTGSLAPGSVVVFENPVNRETWVTHRVVGSNPDGSFVSRGDANSQRDSTPVQPDQIVGVGRIVVPYIGLPSNWMAQGRFVSLILWAAVTLLSMGFIGVFTRKHETSHGGFVPVSLAPRFGRNVTVLVVFVSFAALVFAAMTPTDAAFSGSTANSGNSLAAAGSFDSIEFVQTVDTAECGGSSSVLVVPSGGIRAGDTVLLRIALSGSGSGSTVGASDGANSYTIEAEIAQPNQVRIVVMRAYIDVALEAGDLITVLHPDVRAESVTADQFSGLANAAPTSVGVGSGRSATTFADGLTQEGESLQYGVVANIRNVVHLGASGWSPISAIGSACPRRLDHVAAYRVGAVAGPVDYTTSLSRSTRWVEVLIVYSAE